MSFIDPPAATRLALTSEATTRAAADTTLTTNVATNTTAINTETTRATAAESSAQAAAIAASQGAWNVTAKTGAYTAALWDYVVCDTTGGTFAVAGPAPTAGKQFGVKWKAGTVAPTLTGTFNSAPVFSVLDQAMEFISDAATWYRTVRPALAQIPDYPAVTDTRYGRSQLFDPQNYGAVVGTDNTTAFNSALTAAGANALGGVVIVPNGVWRITGTLTIPNRVTLTGFGSGSIIQAVSDFTMIATAAGADRVTLNNFVIQNTFAGNRTVYDVIFTNTYRPVMTGMELRYGQLTTGKVGVLVLKDTGQTLSANAFMFQMLDCWVNNGGVVVDGVTDWEISDSFIWAPYTGQSAAIELRSTFSNPSNGLICNNPGIVPSVNGGISITGNNGGGASSLRVTGNYFDGSYGGTLLGTGLALTAATDIITATAHGLSAGTRVQLTSIVGAAGVTAAPTYYFVLNPTTNTFQLSLTYGGAVVDITADGTATVTVGSVYTGRGLVNTAGYSFGLVVEGNTFENMSEGAIKLYNCKLAKIQGNHFSNNNKVDNSFNDIDLTSCIGTSTTGNSFMMQNVRINKGKCYVEDVTSSDNLIVNNTVDSGTDYYASPLYTVQATTIAWPNKPTPLWPGQTILLLPGTSYLAVKEDLFQNRSVAFNAANTLTLPSVTSVFTGCRLTCVNYGTSTNVTVATTSSQLINGAAAPVTILPGKTATFYAAAGSGWIMGGS